jgi:HEAT repeat protein
VVLVSLFFGLQILRSRRPDPRATLRSLERYDGFLGAVVGDLKRWQSGYDLSLLLRGQSPDDLRRMVPDLAAALREAGARHDRKLRRYLTLALGYASDPRAAEPLREALADGDAPTRLYAAWGLMRSGPGPAPLELRAALKDDDAGVRKMAAFALGTLNDRDAGADLEEALADEEPDVRWNAALSLARLGDAAAVPTLLAMLEKGLSDGAPTEGSGGGAPGGAQASDVTLNAIRGLALLRPAEAKAPLDRAAASGDPAVRDAARLALQAIAEARDVAARGPSEIR